MRQAALPKKTLLAVSWTGVSMCRKSRASAARWQLGRILVFVLVVFFLLGRNLCGCQRPFASLSLGIVGKAGSLPSIPGTFWGFGFWFFGNGGAGTWDASCVCSRVSIVLNAHFWGSNGLLFWESSSCQILGNGDGCSWEAWILDWGLFQIFSFEKSLEDSVFLNRTIDGFFFPSV